MSDLGLLVVGLVPAGQALPPEVPVQAPDAIAPEALPKVTTSAPESAAIAPQLACRTPVETLHARSSQDCQPVTPPASTTVPAASEPAIAAPENLAATPEVSPVPSPVPLPVPLPMPASPEAIATPELPPLPPASRYLPAVRDVPETLPEVSLENATLEYARLRSPQLDPIERPTNGAQLYRQRMTALAEGKLYTRLSPDSYASVWRQATYQPTYEDWKALLALEARAAARGQGSNQLAILLGDSLSMWFPRELLSPGKFWLNQGISGDTTRGVLQRLSALAATRPNEIYVMAGINDIRLGRSNGEILSNLRAIARGLKQQHPQARIYLQSILPTRYAAIAPSRLRYLNQNIAAIARQEGAIFVDLSPQFASTGGVLTRELTTDGLHLNHLGYRVWQAEMQRARSLDPRGLPFLSQGY